MSDLNNRSISFQSSNLRLNELRRFILRSAIVGLSIFGLSGLLRGEEPKSGETPAAKATAPKDVEPRGPELVPPLQNGSNAQPISTASPMSEQSAKEDSPTDPLSYLELRDESGVDTESLKSEATKSETAHSEEAKPALSKRVVPPPPAPHVSSAKSTAPSSIPGQAKPALIKEPKSTLTIGEPTAVPKMAARHTPRPSITAPIISEPVKAVHGAIKEIPSSISNSTTPNEIPAQLPPNDNATLLGTPKPLTPELLELKKKVQDTIAIFEKRHQNTRDNTAWEVMHAFVAFGAKTEIRRGGPDGVPMNAIGWILYGGRCQSQQLLYLQNGRPHVDIGVGIQGHPAQMLAILAQSRVSSKTELNLQGQKLTLQDLIDEEMLECNTDMELTFKLISFSYYLDLDKTWKNRDGQTWSIPRLIHEELNAPIRGAACGGNHRLFGLTSAFRQRQKTQALDGEYKRAHDYIQSYLRYAYSLQNPDGSFSTEWFARPGNRPDIDRKIQTSGHFLEWMILAQDREQLLNPKMIKAIDFIATTLQNDPQRAWKLGPMGHALHSLVMYNERVFGTPTKPVEVAKREKVDIEPPAANLPQPPAPSDKIGHDEAKSEIVVTPLDKAIENPPSSTEKMDSEKSSAPPSPTRGDQGQEDEQPPTTKRIHIDPGEPELKLEVKP